MGFEDTVERVSMMRQTIAKRLLSGKNDAPHFYLTREIDMTRAIEWRKRLNADANPEQGVPKVSFNDIIMLASAKALRKHPEVNASWEGDTIRKFGHVSISMAVALPTGLVTPVIRNTDMLGVRQIAIQSKDFANRARNNQLSNADYTGGTFTISNLGMADMDEFTAIINPPQSCILAVGATKMRAVVAAGSNEIVARPIMRVTLSCDHRVVDGWVGAMFLKDLVAHLEDPLMMLS
jgi:pyruvate dehydrogenase E2 component (dihydrolipoamide acetyltransferase)